MAQLTANQAAILRMIAADLRAERQCPKVGVLASRLKVRNALVVVFVLRELQELGLLIGAPRPGSTSTNYVGLTEPGWALIEPAPAKEAAPRPRRTGYVVEIAWRCAECGAMSLDVRKPCVACPLLAAAGPAPIWFEPKQGAA